MKYGLRPHNPVLHRETAKAFAQMQAPDFSRVQDWALVQAFAPLFKTRRLPRYWLHDVQRLMRFEHNYLDIEDPPAVLHQATPNQFNGRTVLFLTKAQSRQFILFTQPSPLTLAREPVFSKVACPIELYLTKSLAANKKKSSRP